MSKPTTLQAFVCGPGYSGFTDRWSDEDWELHAAGTSLELLQLQADMDEWLYNLDQEQVRTHCWDPNLCDFRYVRNELQDPRTENLGYRANKVIAGKSRRHR